VTETRTVSLSRKFAAPPEMVFDAWLDPQVAGRWLFRTDGGRLERCEIDPRVGGGFRIDERRGAEIAEHHGEYLALDRPRRIVFDFWTSLSDARSRVTVEIAAEGGGSLLTLTHEGVWAEWEAQTLQGWMTLLDGLAREIRPRQ